MLDGLRLAVGTLTILPTGRLQVTRRVAAVAMTVAPLAVLPLALTAAGVTALGGWLGLPAPVVALLVLAVLALGTRALHLDGLADTVDGLGASWDRDRALEVMRRGDVGPMGVVALVLVLGLQVAALSVVVVEPYGWLGVGGLVLASRAALSMACARPVPAARASGLGAAVAASVPVPVTVLVWVLVGGGCGLLGYATGRPAWVGVAVAAAAGLGVLAALAWCTRRLGGVTGDVLGATVELAFTVLVVGFST